MRDDISDVKSTMDVSTLHLNKSLLQLGLPCYKFFFIYYRIILHSLLTNKMKCSFFQAVVVSMHYMDAN